MKSWCGEWLGFLNDTLVRYKTNTMIHMAQRIWVMGSGYFSWQKSLADHFKGQPWKTGDSKTVFPGDDENWMKHTLSWLDKPYVEDAKALEGWISEWEAIPKLRQNKAPTQCAGRGFHGAFHQWRIPKIHAGKSSINGWKLSKSIYTWMNTREIHL